MTVSEETSFNNVTSSNIGYNNAPALQLRLDTAELIERIEMYLKGEVIISRLNYETGQRQEERIRTDNSKANDKGITALLNYISSIINPQVVQGNFPVNNEGKSKMYDDYIQEVNLDLLDMIMTNLYEWDVNENDANEIINFVMKLVIPFMTRLIENKERESYGDTIRHIENQTVREDLKNKQGLMLGQ